MARLPGKLKRTMAYAAGTAISVFRTMAETVTCRLSSRFSLNVPEEHVAVVADRVEPAALLRSSTRAEPGTASTKTSSHNTT